MVTLWELMKAKRSTPTSSCRRVSSAPRGVIHHDSLPAFHPLPEALLPARRRVRGHLRLQPREHRGLTGPGYFVAHGTRARRSPPASVMEHARIPPKKVATSARARERDGRHRCPGLSSDRGLVRKVSRPTFPSGRPTEEGKELSTYFMLCREISVTTSISALAFPVGGARFSRHTGFRGLVEPEMGGTGAGAKTPRDVTARSVRSPRASSARFGRQRRLATTPRRCLIRRVSTVAPTTPTRMDSLCEGAWWMLELSEPGLAPRYQHGEDRGRAGRGDGVRRGRSAALALAPGRLDVGPSP